MEPFGFVVIGVPRVHKARSRPQWQRTVSDAARAAWPVGTQLVSQEAAVTIVYFYREQTSIDVDNIAKPIIDALKGTIIANDDILSQVVLRKTDQAAIDAVVDAPESLVEVFRVHDNFVYIAMREPPDHTRLPI
jgi:hypothetical protein